MLLIGGLIAVEKRSNEISRRLAVGWLWAVTAQLGVALAEWVARNLDQPHPIGTSSGPTVASLGAALAAWILGALLAGRDPRRPASGPLPPTATRLRLPASARIAWYGRAVPSARLLGWRLGFAALWSAVLGWSLVDTLGYAMVAPGVLLIAITVALDLVWHVRITSAGLTAASWLGWPRVGVLIDEVESAEVGDADLRSGLTSGVDGDVGIVVRGGEALVVHMTGGRRLIITVSDPDAAARVLNTLAERARTAVEPGAGSRGR